jgi:transposase
MRMGQRGRDAPWVREGAMNRDLFARYVETKLAPTLRPGDVIIFDNQASHNRPKAADAMRAIAAQFLFLPP